MKNLFLSIILIFSVISLFASKGFDVGYEQSGSSTHTLDFNISDFQISEVTHDGTIFTKIIFDGSVTTEIKGYAELPYVHATVMISPNKNINLEIIGGEYVEYNLNYPLLPSRGVIYRTQNPDEIPYVIDPGSIVDAWYPKDLAVNNDPFIIKDFRGTSVYVYPFQYNAERNILRFYQNIKVKVVENNEQPVYNPLTQVSDNILYEMDAIYRSVFINYPQGRDDLTIGEYGEILVICTDRDAEAIDPYIEWKTEKGMKVHKEIVATGTNVVDLVQEKYDENNNILYVLLVGDWADIKCDTYGSAPMDPQVGCVVGTDVHPDICIGRFSANSPDDVTTQVNKVITYERNPEPDGTWYASAIGVASTEGATNGDDSETDYEHNDVIYYNKLNPFTYTNYTPVYDPSANSTMVTNAVEEGATLINYTGHGSATSWGTSGFNNSHVAALTNGEKLPVVISVACNNGDFHTGECFAEKWTKKEDGGAIIFVGASISQPWAPPMRGQDYFMDVMTGGYDYAQYPGQNGISTFELRNTVGSIIFNGLTLMIVESSSGSDLETAKTWNTFGDPSLQIRTDVPRAISLNNNVILVGAPFETTVTAGGEPIAGAMVSLYKDGEAFSAITDEFGSVSITNTFEPGDCKLVVTGMNILTVYEDATIIPPDGPYLIIDDCLIGDASGNGNGEPDFGEEITLDIALRNVGIAPASNVSATLTTGDSYITITSGQFTYGTIPADSIYRGSTFSVTIADDIPDMHAVEFVLEMFDDSDNSWNSSFFINVSAPTLGIAFDHIDDYEGDANGRLDAGETADIYINGLNLGHSLSPEGELSVSSTSQYVTLNSTTANIEGVEPEGSTEVSFNISISETTPLATDVNFTFIYTAGEYSYETTVSKPVGLILEDWESSSFSSFNWELSGDSDWFVSDVLPYEGDYCIQSGNIGDGQEVELQITVEVLADDSISFYKKVSSEQNWDFLEFWVDNQKVGSWSGTVDWSRQVYPIGAGVYTFKWIYMKDNYYSNGQDCGWIDYIIFPPMALTVDVDDLDRTINEVKAFPNPFADMLNFQYTIEESSEVRLSVFNALGQQVSLIEKGTQLPGEHIININGANFEKGMYYWRLEIGEDISTGKLIRSE